MITYNQFQTMSNNAYNPPQSFTYYDRQIATFLHNYTNGSQYVYEVFDVRMQQNTKIILTQGNINYYLKEIKQL
jgi:hypothetical protein